jgi:proteic killer suppression protein
MIGSFKDAALEALYFEGPSSRTRRIPQELHAVLRRKLDQLYNAVGIRDLRVPPGNRLEALRGEWQGWHSIRVNDQWRIVFRWRENAAYDVGLTDYH